MPNTLTRKESFPQFLIARDCIKFLCKVMSGLRSSKVKLSVHSKISTHSGSIFDETLYEPQPILMHLAT